MAKKALKSRLKSDVAHPRKILQETIGFVVGRFQVKRLTRGHRHLIRWALKRHKKIAVLVGQTGSMVGNSKNALNFEMVKAMIEQTFPKLKHRMVILRIEDNTISHFYWAEDVDTLLRKMFPGRSFIGYGGRDSFLNQYVGAGEFDTERVPDVPSESGTEHRAKIAFPNTEDGRAALLWYHDNRPNFMFSTGDLAIYDKKKNRVLLVGKKKWRGLLAFMGGHAEKLDQGARNTTAREGGEEIPGITIGPLEAIDSSSIPDPRYRGTDDGVMTNFYVAPYIEGTPRANDDIEYVEWVSVPDLQKRLVPWHSKLGKLFVQHIQK